MSKHYKEMGLSKYNRDTLKKNWIDALNFFFDREFFGGDRSDDLSEYYENYAMRKIRDCFKNKHQIITDEDIENITKELEGKTDTGYIFPKRDRKMVVQSLKKLIKISEDSGDHNIIKYAIEQLGSCELERVKDFIEELSKIQGIAIKRSTSFLRDLFDVFKLEKKITKSSQKRKIFMYLQPIDRWVFNVSKQLEILEPTAELQDKYWEENASNIVDICLIGSKNEISPIKFNQGGMDFRGILR